MAVYKRGEIYHYDFSYKNERYRGSTGHKKKAQADRWLSEYRESLKLGESSGRKTHTLREAADKWFSTQIVGSKTELTVAMRVKILLRHINGGLAVADIGPSEISDAILSRRLEPIRQSSPKNPRFPTNGTVNRDIIDTTLRPIMNFAEEALEERVRRIKWSKLRLKEPKGRVREFTPEELASWRQELPEWHRPLFDFMARYGVRLGEAFFPPSAVKVGACEVLLDDTKNGSDHGLTIRSDDMADLAGRKTRAAAAELDTIWFRDVGGDLQPIHWRAFQSASKTALDRAGILNARPAHDLRHHAATTLHRETGSLKLVQDLLNHQDIASSARYAHTNKADLRAALERTYGAKVATKSSHEPKSSIDSNTANGT